MTELNIPELKAAALVATPGPWADGVHTVYQSDSIPGGERICKMMSAEDSAFIAAANPAAVLELIAEVERLRAAVGSAEPFTYYKEPHDGWPEYSTENEFSDGKGGGLPLYTAPPAPVSAEPEEFAPEPVAPYVGPDTAMAKPMPINALWDAIGVYCEAVIDDELAACGIGEKLDPRMRIGSAKRLIDLIGDRTDHDSPASPANRLHKDAHSIPVATPSTDAKDADRVVIKRSSHGSTWGGLFTTDPKEGEDAARWRKLCALLDAAAENGEFPSAVHEAFQMGADATCAAIDAAIDAAIAAKEAGK